MWWIRSSFLWQQLSCKKCSTCRPNPGTLMCKNRKMTLGSTWRVYSKWAAKNLWTSCNHLGKESSEIHRLRIELRHRHKGWLLETVIHPSIPSRILHLICRRKERAMSNLLLKSKRPSKVLKRNCLGRDKKLPQLTSNGIYINLQLTNWYLTRMKRKLLKSIKTTDYSYFIPI